MLFETKIGFSYNGVLHYYLGDEENFILPKTATGILKTILPHIFSFGLFMMVILHFLLFTKYKNTKHLAFLIKAAYISAFLELVSPFFIIYGISFFAYVKLFSFISLEFIIIYILFLLFFSIYHD